LSWTFTGETSNLTSDAAQGQKDCAVVDGSKFQVKDLVVIEDSSNWETNIIASIVSNTLTMVNNLQHTYYVAAGGKVTIKITLPIPPTKISDKGPTDIKSHIYPGDLPLLISMGNKAEVLSLDGFIAEEGKDSAFLEAHYLLPLMNQRHRKVTLTAPETRYNSDYLLATFVYYEEGAKKRSFPYKLELWKGKIYVVL